MGLVYGCIAPHGGPIIAEVAGEELVAYEALRNAMEELGRRVKAQNLDTIVLLTPHGLRLQGEVAIYTCEQSSGSMSGGGNTVRGKVKCDKELAQAILQETKAAGIPAVGCNYGAMSGPGSDILMDWGTFIPLWFCGMREQQAPQVVIIGPTREIPLEQLVELGRIIARAAEQSGKRVGLVASADQGHAHDADGPYGFHPAAAAYDAWMQGIIRENRLADLLQADMNLVEQAKPDSLWQTLSLYGASTVVPMHGEMLCYDLPSYFGMLVAGYEVIG